MRMNASTIRISENGKKFYCERCNEWINSRLHIFGLVRMSRQFHDAFVHHGREKKEK